MSDQRSSEPMGRSLQWQSFGSERLEAHARPSRWQLPPILHARQEEFALRFAGIRSRVREMKSSDLLSPAWTVRVPFATPVPSSPEEAETSHDLEMPVSSEPPPPQRFLEASYQRTLERFLEFRMPRIRVRTDRLADAVAREQGADAVAIRDEVFFRQGKYEPGSRAGLGLLAHEATHLAWSHGFRPAGLAGPTISNHAEEHVAQQKERAILQSAPSTYGRNSELVQASTASLPNGHALAKTAASNRDLGTEPMESSPPPMAAEPDLRRLKEEIYQTLLEKLRSDFERGA